MNIFPKKFPSVIPDYIKGNLSVPLNDSITFWKKNEAKTDDPLIPFKKDKGLKGAVFTYHRVE